MRSGRYKINRLVLVFILISALLMSACGKDVSTSSQKKSFVNLTAESIDTNQIMSTIKELASQKYTGRLAGTEGNNLAVEYISNYFKEIGLENPKGIENYLQPYKQKVMNVNSAPVLQILDSQGKVIKDFVYPQNFVSYATQGSKIKGEIKQNAVLINNTSEITADNANLKNKLVLVPDAIRRAAGGAGKVIEALTMAGAKGFINEMDVNNAKYLYKHLPVAPNADDNTRVDNENGLMYVNVESQSFKEIADATIQGSIIRLKLDGSVDEVEVSNVIGLIPGSDEKLKNEYIIIGAHLDHVGDNKNGTYNPGAFDNGSGTAVMMELARILKQSKAQPKKSILFIAFNGEEEGLHGAYHYANNPIYPMTNAVMINLDMVGSKTIMPLMLGNAFEGETNLRNDLYEYANTLGVSVVKDVEPASDHTPFAEAGVEAITLINMDVTNPGYHTNLDTIENTLNQQRIGEAAKLVLFYLDKKAY